MHAAEFLKRPPAELPLVGVIFGDQLHLKQQVVAALVQSVIGGDDTALTKLDGKSITFGDLIDELRTVSMFADRRLVVVQEADDFISEHRAALEKYCEKPAKKSLLLFDAKSWAKTTRLAKWMAKSGLEVDCSELKGAELRTWITETATHAYERKIDRDAVTLLIELVGGNLGALDQELAKLAAYVGPGATIPLEAVRSLVGGWQTETTWAMTNAVRDGDLGQALRALDELLTAGEAPLKLFAGISFVYRKLATAVELSRQLPLKDALKEAGVFFRDWDATESYLRRLGRARAERILGWLLETDLGLKGSSRLPERFQLEQLLIRLSGVTAPAGVAAGGA